MPLRFKNRVPLRLVASKADRAAYRRCADPQGELTRKLLAIDENRIKAFLDAVAQLAVEDVMREQQEEAADKNKNRFRIRIRACA